MFQAKSLLAVEDLPKMVRVRSLSLLKVLISITTNLVNTSNETTKWVYSGPHKPKQMKSFSFNQILLILRATTPLFFIKDVIKKVPFPPQYDKWDNSLTYPRARVEIYYYKAPLNSKM